MADKVQMVAFRSHVRDDGELVRKGEEFQVTEEQAHAYASRESPLAGPLDDEPEDKPKRRAATKSSRKGKGK